MLSLQRRNSTRPARELGPYEEQATSRLGPYRLCLELASGGMGTVYLAHRESELGGGVGRFVAVKVVHPHLANDRRFMDMFRDEAEIASRIRHVNVCSVLDFDVSDGASYIAMEYLSGEPMSSIFRKLVRHPPGDVGASARRIAKALADCCEGLHTAHELNDAEGDPLDVVHRDVSPANLLLTFDGVAKVVDFGVAAAAHKRHRTEAGILKGKLAYVAPECLRGLRADRRADVWAVGVVAWELLTGRRLFARANELDTVKAVTDLPIQPPSVVRPELGTCWDEVLMQAVTRDLDARYPTARALGRDLLRLAIAEGPITNTDLAEWLETLFPGGKERSHQLLELAGQIAQSAHEHTPPRVSTRTAGPVSRTIGDEERELAPTRVKLRPPKPPPRMARSAWRMPLVGLLGLVLGGAAVGVGEYLATATRAQEPVRQTIVNRVPAPPPSLQVPRGVRLAHGDYVLDVQSADRNELVLRITPAANLPASNDAVAIEPVPEPAPPPPPLVAPPPIAPWRR